MKKLYIFHFALISLFCIPSLFAQDYLTEITYKSCECLADIAITEDREQFNLELGLCIIDASKPYKKELKKDHGINLDNISQDGTRLGELIGINMAGICPEEILKLTNDNEVDQYNETSSYTSGIITKIEKEQFVVFSLKDETGKTTKYHWMSFIDSEFDLPNEYSNLTGKKVELYYYENEFYDARIDEYKSFFIIEEMNIIQ